MGVRYKRRCGSRQRLVASRSATWSALATGELRAWIATALERIGESTPPHVWAKLALNAARATVTFGPFWGPENDPEAGIEAGRRALALARHDDPRAVATAQFGSGWRFATSDVSMRLRRFCAKHAPPLARWEPKRNTTRLPLRWVLRATAPVIWRRRTRWYRRRCRRVRRRAAIALRPMLGSRWRKWNSHGDMQKRRSR
jgi:hypothetical protein